MELAQLDYLSARLVRGWTHLERQKGGIGLRGPGETQLEVDRREIGRKITQLKKELEAVRAHRGRHRAQRERAGIPTVALVGYTNAGKSTLINALTNSDIYVADQLFATLDPTTRRVALPSGRIVLLSDTVGFIQKLPVSLVAAFRATLEEVVEADVLVHVVDVSHAKAWYHVEVVEDTLAELDAVRVPKILVLNKIDLGENCTPIDYEALGYETMVRISAQHGTGLKDLLDAIGHVLAENMIMMSLLVPYTQGDVLSAIHNRGVMVSERHIEKGIEITARVPLRLAGQLAGFVIKPTEGGGESTP